MHNPCAFACGVRCLSATTAVATPKGEVNVKDLQEGMLVWSQDRHGNKVAVPVLKVSKIAGSFNDKVVHLVLAGGRELWVTPDHVLASQATGKTAKLYIGELKKGDRYDNSEVISTDLVPYNHSHTYDLLLAGETGYYWANGILMASTLKEDK